MSKNKQEQAEASSLIVQETVRPPAEQPQGSKVQRLSPKQEWYTAQKQERNLPALLTVEQYLSRAKQDAAVADLIRSWHKTNIMPFADWERETAALLKRKTW
jgi:hypothetical protein